MRKKRPERFCWICSTSMGFNEDGLFRKGDTCGSPECEYEAGLRRQKPERARKIKWDNSEAKGGTRCRES